jgi:hypothetical protein
MFFEEAEKSCSRSCSRVDWLRTIGEMRTQSYNSRNIHLAKQ